MIHSERGFAHILLIVAVIGVMGLMVFSNSQMMSQLSSKTNVLGVATSQHTDTVNQILTVAQSLIEKIAQFIGN
jgi:hypothetical protein